MKDRADNSNLEFTNLVEAEFRLDAITIRGDFKIGSDQTICTEDDLGKDKTVEVG